MEHVRPRGATVSRQTMCLDILFAEAYSSASSEVNPTMAGQIIKRGDNTWLVRVFTGRDGNGKRRYINKTIKGKKKEAQSYLSETLTKISTGIFVEPVKLTLDEYLDKWLEAAARPRLSERTFADYKEVLKRYVRPKLGSVRLNQLLPLDIQALYSEMGEQELSPRTIRG